MAALNDSEWDELARDLAQRVDVVAPDWTNQQESDPGITIAELIAFLAESLLGRPGRSHSAITRLSNVVKDLNAKVQDAPCREAPELTRVRYFHGQLLSAADFEQEQNYLRSKQRRHNLLLHGMGIVSGLDVTVEPGHDEGGPLVAVSPGLAIGPDGEELLVCERMTSPLESDRASCFVTLRLEDRLGDMVPTPEGEEASRVVEVVEIGVLADVPASHLALARVERADHTWRLDPTFRAARPDR